MITFNFLITSLIVVLIPGTGAIYTVSVGIAHGKRASAFAALGCTAGILPHLAANILGLAALLHASALAFEALKYAGAAYLMYLAFSIWRDTSGMSTVDTAAQTSGLGIAVKAFLMNILNPKLSIFFLAFLPQFIGPGDSAAMATLLLLSAVFMAMTFIVFVAYGLLANSFRVAVLESARVQRWMQRSFALAFAGLGINLALSNR